ncbi:hypothetical protein [Streptomyces sp. NPDC003730]
MAVPAPPHAGDHSDEGHAGLSAWTCAYGWSHRLQPAQYRAQRA